jgi:hypothetical protein
MAEVKVNDQNTRSITSQNKTEIDAIVQLLLHHMDTSRLIQEIEKRNMEQNQFATIAAADIAHGASPFTQPPQQMQPQSMQPMEQQPMQ